VSLLFKIWIFLFFFKKKILFLKVKEKKEKNAMSKNQTKKREKFFFAAHQRRSLFRLSANNSSRPNSDSVSEKFLFLNSSFDKNRLKSIVSWFFEKHGQYKTLKFLEKLKEFGFGFATTAGISLGIDDLRIPNEKISMLAIAETKVAKDLSDSRNAKITGVERVQRFMYTWNQTNDTLKQEVVKHFEQTDLFNPIYMMAFSGARGNMSQVRQLVGMRGLMSDPQGQIIDFPIQSNFREGLTLTEYLISTYGARKGIVDTALRTATAGYLTRRLVDVAQHTIVSHFDCGTMRGIFLFDMKEGKKTIYSFQNRLIGRVLAQDISFEFADQQAQSSSEKSFSPRAFRNQEIDSKLARALGKATKKAFVRSPLTCETARFVCQLCYGWSFSYGKLVSVGEAVGILAAQSIGEPGTQLTMRTFHTGGVFAGGLTDQILAPFDGQLQFFQSIPGSCVRTSLSEIAFFTKTPGSFFLQKKRDSHPFQFEEKRKHEKKQQLFSEVFRIPAYALLFCRNNEFVQKKQVLAQFSSVLRKVQYGSAEQTFFSTLAGEFVFGNSFFGQKKIRFASFDQSTPLSLQMKEPHTSSSSRMGGIESGAVVSADQTFTQNKPWERDVQKQQNLLFEKKHGDFSELELKNDILWKSQNWSKIWILSGKIFYNSFDTNFWICQGDFLKTTSVLNRILWKKTKKVQYVLLSQGGTKTNSFLPYSRFFENMHFQKKKKEKLPFLFSEQTSKKLQLQKIDSSKAKNFLLNLSKSFGQKTQKKLTICDFQFFFSVDLQKKFLFFQPFSAKTRKEFMFSTFKRFEIAKKTNDLVFFQKKSNRFFTNFEKIQFLFQKTSRRKKRFLLPALPPSKSRNEQRVEQKKKGATNSLNFVFFKFAKKRKKDVFFSFLQTLKYSNEVQTSQKFGFFSLLHFRKQQTLNKNFQKRSFPQFQNFQKISFQKNVFEKSVSNLFDFRRLHTLTPKKEKRKEMMIACQDAKFSIKESNNFHKFSKNEQKYFFLGHQKNTKISKNILFKKVIFRVAVEKIRYRQFGYVSSFSKPSRSWQSHQKSFRNFLDDRFSPIQPKNFIEKNKNLQTLLRNFSTFKQNENDFEINPGKKKKDFSFGNENFFGKEFPNFLSSSFFKNFQTKMSGFFYIRSFENFQNQKCFENFLAFQNSVEGFHQFFFQINPSKKEFSTNQSFLHIFHFPDVFSSFFEKQDLEKRMKIVLCQKKPRESSKQGISKATVFPDFLTTRQSHQTNRKKIFLFQIDTFSLFSISRFSSSENLDSFNQGQSSKVFSLREKMKNQKNFQFFSFPQKIFEKNETFFEFQKEKFFGFDSSRFDKAKKNFEKLFPTFSFIEKKKTFFFSNSPGFRKAGENFFLALERKQKNISHFQVYTKEICWLPEENFFVLTLHLQNQKSLWSQTNRNFFFSKKNSFVHLVNRQGKKKRISFDFDGLGKFSKIQKFQKAKKKIHQKLSFSKKTNKQTKFLQKTFVSTFEKRKNNETFQKIQNLFVFHSKNLLHQKKQSAVQAETKKTLFLGKEKKSLFARSHSRKKKKKNFVFFSKMQTNQTFTCIPLKKRLLKSQEKWFSKSFLQKEKIHLKIQPGWLIVPFFSKRLFDSQKKILKNGSFFGTNFSFEQNNVLSETILLDSSLHGFSNFEKSKKLSFQILRKKTKEKEQISFSVKSFEKNKKCRFFSSFHLIEQKNGGLNLFQHIPEKTSAFEVLFKLGKKRRTIAPSENDSTNSQKSMKVFSLQPKRKFFLFFRSFEYKRLENSKNTKKYFQNFQVQSFSRIFSLDSFLELSKKYHSDLLNCQKKEKIHSSFFSEDPPSYEEREAIEMSEERSFRQKKETLGIEFFSNFQKMYFSPQTNQTKKILFEQKSFVAPKKKTFFQNFLKTTFFLQSNKKNTFQNFENSKNALSTFSFSPVQFLPLILSFSQSQSTSFFHTNFPICSHPSLRSDLEEIEERKAGNREFFSKESLKTNGKFFQKRLFPLCVKNSLKNTIEYSFCEKKAPFLDQKFGVQSFFGNLKKTSFWLTKEKMSFVFSFEKSKTNLQFFPSSKDFSSTFQNDWMKKMTDKEKVVSQTSVAFQDVRETKNSFLKNSIFKNNKDFYGNTKILSPFEGELLSLGTHEMNWWEKASKISTLQKFEKLLTIVTKKDLFSVQFSGDTISSKEQAPFSDDSLDSSTSSTKGRVANKARRAIFSLRNGSGKSKKWSESEHSRNRSKQKDFEKLYEIVRNSTTKVSLSNFEKFDHSGETSKRTKVPSFVTKYEQKVYTFQNLKIGSPSLSKIPNVGNFVFYGDCFLNSALQKPGQIVHMNSKRLTLRRGQPFFVSFNGILHFSKIPYIRKNVPVVTLPYQTVQAGDIVQGIPKVEQYFEARTTIQGRLFVSSLPILLKGIFERYKTFLPLEQATRQSFLKIQQILVDGVQRVYRSQGVSITDKHLEIIVRQMTTKVQILHGAQTGFFPGELVNLDFVERLNKFLMVKIRYEPVLLGITRASLEVESFLSASSFQQTTKILSLAAISQKKDFLKGLKENLFVGNLIPAGTGYFTLTKNH
jgi:hypothetical protein